MYGGSRRTQDAETYGTLGQLLHFSRPLCFRPRSPPKLARSPKEMCCFLHKELPTRQGGRITSLKEQENGRWGCGRQTLAT